jgi:GTPase
MAEQNFVDYVKICCRSGKGGAGSVHFYRDVRTAKGGPDGGDGGRGGHIILKGNAQLWTLLHLKYRKHVIGDNGNNGTGNNKTGSDGEDVVLEVPLGTIARDAESGLVECEITTDGQTHVLVPGGRGGLGNTNFKSSTRQTPRFAQPGEPGREEWKILELKILADVGLVGFPNAGKSTLLASVTAAKPKIASYPFTTLVPNLGIVSYRDHRSFAMADIPGIIEKAHEGKGLGHRFLRHIERNAVLLFLIPVDEDDIGATYRILLHELAAFNEELLHKPRLLAISKCDMIDQEMEELIKPTLPEGVPHIFISAVSGKGLVELKDILWTMLESSAEEE